MAASKFIQMFSFSLLIGKILSYSGRFGMGESKCERKFLLYPGIGVGGGGPASLAHELCCRLLSEGRLSGVKWEAYWHSPWQALAWDLALLLATRPPPKLPLYPSSLGETMNDTLWHRPPPHFWSHALTSSLSDGPRTQASLLQSSTKLVGSLWSIQPA